MLRPFHLRREYVTAHGRRLSPKHERYGLYFRGDRVAFVYLSGENAFSENTILPLRVARALCERHNEEYLYNRALQPSRWSFALDSDEEPHSIAGKYARKGSTRNARKKVRDFGAFCRATGRAGIMFVDGMKVSTIEDGNRYEL